MWECDQERLKWGAARVDPAFQEPCHKGAEKPARAGGGQGSRERDLRAFGPDSRRKGARAVPEGGHPRVKARAPCPSWGDLGGPKDRTLGRGGPEPVVQYQGRPPDGGSAAFSGAGSGETRGEGPRSPHRSPTRLPGSGDRWNLGCTFPKGFRALTSFSTLPRPLALSIGSRHTAGIRYRSGQTTGTGAGRGSRGTSGEEPCRARESFRV